MRAPSLPKGNPARSGGAAPLLAAMLALAALLAWPQMSAAQELRTVIEKTNLYIEVAKGTERGAESWERYLSWVNLKTGPTGKERYISYGLYELHDLDDLFKQARAAASANSDTPALDAAVARCIESYQAMRPVANRAAAYYDDGRFRKDKLAEGKVLHKRLVPLASNLMADREALLQALRPHLRDVEGLEVAATEAREGRSVAFHAGRIINLAGRVVDVFPRVRPTPLSSDDIDAQIRALGPTTPGAKFDEIIAGVARPKEAVVIDVNRFDAALRAYAAAVDEFDKFVADNQSELSGKQDGLKDFKTMPRHLLDGLRTLHEPLVRHRGREFDGAGGLMARIVDAYYSMLTRSNSVSRSQLRFLP